MKTYGIGFYNSDNNFDNAFDVILESSSKYKAGSPAEIEPNFANFNLKNIPFVVIFLQTEENTTDITKKHLTFKKLVTIYGKYVPKSIIKKAYDDATNEKLDNQKGEGIIEPNTYDTPQDGLPLPYNGGGLLDGLFPFTFPNIIFLVGAALGTFKYFDTGNPIYGAAGIYSFLHYRKNLNSKINGKDTYLVEAINHIATDKLISNLFRFNFERFNQKQYNYLGKELSDLTKNKKGEIIDKTLAMHIMQKYSSN